jgi:antitoxin component of MazEF toxin-antitoxin module
MVKIKGKVMKIGNSYAITIRKALVDAEVLSLGEYIEAELIQRKGLKITADNHTETLPPLLSMVRVSNRSISAGCVA